MADPSKPRFVAIANGTYAELPALSRAVSDSRALADLLQARHDFDPAILSDLERGAVLDAIEEKLAKAGMPGGSLIVSWIGHAKKGDNDTLRLMGRSAGRDVELATAGQLGEWAARTGARQVLVLIDTCYSGSGVVDAVAAATAVDNGRAAPGMASFCVIAASLSDEPSRSGVLVRELQRLLAEGPRKPDFRWDRSRRYITGHDLAQALLEDWSEPRHTPYVVSAGRVFDLVHNPLFERGVPDQPVEHLLAAARGGSGDESFFTGRERALTEIVAWIGRGEPGLFVVTGPPGCGKSAVVGRIVSLSFRGERARLLQSGPIPAALDPGAGSVDVQIHARGVTTETASEALAQQLKIDPGAGVFGVLGEARRRRQAGDPPVFVIDGLDEARAFSDVAVELLARLAREALVLVASRDVPFGDTTLIRLLGPAAGLVDLGQDAAATRRDVRDYVVKRLAGVSPAMDPAVVAGELAGEGGAPTEAPFLLARLITSQLREHPVDTSSEDWRPSLSTSVQSALELDLQSVVLAVDGKPVPAAAREMIRALALAHGAGFPADDVWPAVATATSEIGARYSRDNAYTVLTSLGRHIIASSEGEQPVYRIAHQRLVDYLLDGSPPDRPAVAEAIFRTFQEILDLGVQPREHRYLWRYAWVHLAEGGAAGLELLRGLAGRDREAFLPDLASGLELAAIQAWSAGLADKALPLAEEAVAHRREIGDAVKLVLSLFQLSLLRSSVGEDKGADEAAGQASSLAREAGDRPGARAALVAALSAQATTQVREGRHKAAKLLAEEAIALAEPSKSGDASLWQSLAYAHLAAGQAAMATADLESASTSSRTAVRILDEHVGLATGRDALLEALSLLAAVDFARALSGASDSAGTPLPASTDAASRVLEMFRMSGPQGNLSDIAASRGLQFLVRARFVDRVRGLPVSDIDSLPAILETSIDLVRPLAGQIADAAILLAAGLILRSGFRQETEPARTAEDRAEAERTLRGFARRSPLVSVELGEMLAAEGAMDFQPAMRGEVPDLEGLIRRELEAASLLRPATKWFNRNSLAATLTRLASLFPMKGVLTQQDLEQEIAVRAEAIDVWRSLVGVATDAPVGLVSMLSDQAGRLLDRRTAEAAELAREALERCRELPMPRFESLLGGAELNLAAVELRMGEKSGSRELLRSSIRHLEPSAGVPIYAGILAAAYTNLAHVESDAGNFADALPAAQKALVLYGTPGLPAFLTAGRAQASLALGRAQRGSGQAEQGTATLREVVGELRSSLVEGRIDFTAFAGALNAAAPDLWDEVLRALGDRQDLSRRLSLIRQRPRSEIDVTVREIAAALASPQAGELRTIRAIARQQRSVDPDSFDSAWRRQTGEVPPWLRLPSGHEDLVIAWWNTPNWELSRKYLEAHPALLGSETEIVLEELRLEAQNPATVDLHGKLLAQARVQGVEAAYAPLLAEVTAREWMSSEDPQAHLTQHPELLRPEVAAWLRERAAEGEEAASAFGAVLLLAQRGETALAFQAAADAGSVLPHLRSAWRSRDAARLSALATIVRLTADDPAAKRTATAAAAISRVLEKNENGLPALLEKALDGAAEADRQEMAEVIADAIAHHPADAADLARLIPMLGGAPS
jgi:tetratricopeptide (TPR) repeat protein